MWIAFIFQYLWDTKQLSFVEIQVEISCELLSFFSIFGIQNNAIAKGYEGGRVVNCFHFSVSLGYKTTYSRCLRAILCCELLSFFSIFGIQNNPQAEIDCPNLVVNCFHFSVSLGYKTTFKLYFPIKIVLWIAFIFQYLWDTKQLAWVP